MSLNLEENKALVRRFFTAVESGDFHVFDEIVAQDYDDHLVGQGRGRVTLKQYFAGLHSAFADLKLPISTMVAEGDQVAVLSAVRGTHTSLVSGPLAERSTRWPFSSIELKADSSRSIGKSRTSRK
ncbi:ketosteroid isomerase-like protein [Bradyrhizobium sp. LM2.7]